MIATRSGREAAASQPRFWPFQAAVPCRKPGGVCSIRAYSKGPRGRLGDSAGEPVITCPKRFEEGQLLVHWLADIVGFRPDEVMIAREVPFMRGSEPGKAAGMIDFVVAQPSGATLPWYGLEIQAAYSSG